MLSLADVDKSLMMEDDSLVWTSKDVVIVLEHQNEKVPLRYGILVCFMIFFSDSPITFALFFSPHLILTVAAVLASDLIVHPV